MWLLQAYWNVPAQRCYSKYNISMPLNDYHIVHNQGYKFIGNRVSGFSLATRFSLHPVGIRLFKSKILNFPYLSHSSIQFLWRSLVNFLPKYGIIIRIKKYLRLFCYTSTKSVSFPTSSPTTRVCPSTVAFHRLILLMSIVFCSFLLFSFFAQVL